MTPFIIITFERTIVALLTEKEPSALEVTLTESPELVVYKPALRLAEVARVLGRT
jgi:hypothetical protein